MTAHRVDTTLLKDLSKYGAFDVSACFNCGNCTAVCQHSDEGASFPRRLIRYGQLGMRDRLLASKEAWLCWNCRDCSDTCPRQARPSEYLEAVRRYTIAALDPTGIGRLLYSSVPFLIGFSLLLSALFAGVLLSQSGTPSAGRLDLFGFIPFELIHDMGIAVMVLLGLTAVITTIRLVRRLADSTRTTGEDGEERSSERFPLDRGLSALVAVLEEMAVQRRFRVCEVDAKGATVLRPWFVHYTIMWGFIGLGVATAFDFIFKTPGSAVALWYPSRLLGTVAGLSLVYGTTVTMVRWLQSSDRTRTRMLPSDWLFVGLLHLIGLTGFALEAMEYLPGDTGLGYGVFLVHVVLAMDLLLLFPFTKFAHALYRPLAYGIYRFRTARTRDVAAAEMGAD